MSPDMHIQLCGHYRVMVVMQAHLVCILAIFWHSVSFWLIFFYCILLHVSHPATLIFLHEHQNKQKEVLHGSHHAEALGVK